MGKNDNDLSGKVGLDITDFRANISALSRQIKVIETGFKASAAGMTDWGNSAEGLQARIKSLTSIIELQKKKVENLNEQYKLVAKEQGENSKQANDLKIKINNQTTALKKLEAELINANSLKLEKLANQLDTVGNKIESTGKKMMVLSAAVVAGAAYAAKAAIDYESAFAGVEKTVDGTEKQLDKLSTGIRKMATNIPVAATEISGVAEAAGQLGIATDNILAFTRVMVDLGKSTNLSASQAATALAKFANITQMSADKYASLGSAIVDLGNKSATTEADIVSMATKLASAGTLAGFSEADILGVSAALSSVGVEAEAGGSAMAKLIKKIQVAVETGSKDLENYASVAGMTADAFSSAFEKDAAGALASFIEGLKNTESSGKSAIVILEEMGLTEVRLSNSILSLSSAGDLLSTSLKTSSNAWSENTALATEAEKRYATTESQLQIAQNQLTEIAITMGSEFLPMVNKAIDGVENIGEWFATLNEAEKQNVVRILAIVAAMGPMIAISGKTVSAIGGIITAINAYKTAAATGAAATTAFGAALNATPVGLIATGIALVGSAIIGSLVANMLTATDTTETFAEGMNRLNSKMDETTGTLNAINQYRELSDAMSDSSISSEELKEKQSELTTVKQELIEGSGGIVTALGEENGVLNEQIDLLEKQTQNTRDLLAAEIELKLTQMKSELPQLKEEINALQAENNQLTTEGTQIASKGIELQGKLNEIMQLINSEAINTVEGQERYNKLLREASEISGSDFFSDTMQVDAAVDEITKTIDDYSEAVTANTGAIEKNKAKINETEAAAKTLVERGYITAEEATARFGVNVDALTDSTEKSTDATEDGTDTLDDYTSSTDKANTAISEQTEIVSKATAQLETAADDYWDVVKAQDYTATSAANLMMKYADLISENADLLMQYPELYAALDNNNTMQENSAAVAKAIFEIKKQLLIQELTAQKDALNTKIDTLIKERNAAIAAAKGIAGAMSLAYSAAAGNDKAIADAKASAATIQGLIDNLNKADLNNFKATVKSTSSSAKTVTSAFKKAREELDYLHDMGVVGDKEYYEKLQKLQSKHLKKNSAEWKDVNVEIQKWQSKQNENLLKESEDTYDKLFDNLNNSYKNGTVGLKTFLADSERLRNTYLKKNSDKWTESYNTMFEKIENIESERLKNIQEDYTSAIDDISKAQESMQEKLANFGDIATITETDSGNVAVALNNWKDQTKVITDFGAALDELKGKGIPTSLLSEIASMDVKEGLAVSSTLLGLSDEQWATQMVAWDAKQQAAKVIAEAYYADDVKLLKTNLTDAVTGLEQDMTASGLDLGGNITDGIVKGIKDGTLDVEAAMAGMASAALASARNTLGVASPSKEMEKTGINTDEGYAQGIDKGAAAVQSKMKVMLQGVIAQANQAKINAEITASVGSSIVSDLSRTTPKAPTTIQPAVDHQASLTNALISGVKMAMQSSSATRNTAGTDITLEVDGITLGRVALPYIQKEAARLGIKLTEV